MSRRPLGMEPAPAICYSGYRRGQSPRDRVYPSHAEIREDLHLLAPHYRLLRLYDPTPHAERVLEVIREDGLDLRIMLGLELAAEVNNPECPWGSWFDEPTLEAHRRDNDAEVEAAIALVRRFPDEVFAVAAGNEALVGWSDHKVPEERVIGFVRRLRGALPQPVTFCENWVPWAHELDALAAELDFLSMHTYPVWEGRSIDEAMDYSRENYAAVVGRHPDLPVIISEAGWTTRANGRGIEPWKATAESQARYCRELVDWSGEQGVLCFLFEAFDEPWKGSDDPDEPEKHWGLYDEDRSPKPVVAAIHPEPS